MAGRMAAVAALLALVAGGCAENLVRLDAAREVSDTSRRTMRDLAAYFDEVESRRRAAAAALVASDPSCRPFLRFRMQYSAGVDRGARQPLCPPDGVVAPGYLTADLNFERTPEAVMKPRLLLIAAVADYGVALARILDDPKADITGEVTAFADKVDSVSKLLALLGKDDLPTLGGAVASDEGQSVLALLDFANALRHEADQVRAVRTLVGRDGKTVDAALAKLDSIVELRVSQDIRSAQRTQVEALAGAYDRERATLGFPERHALATAVLEARAEQPKLAEKTATIRAAIAATQEAQSGLRDALAGHFTKAQRRRIVSENLNRLTHAFNLIAAVGTAFG